MAHNRKILSPSFHRHRIALSSVFFFFFFSLATAVPFQSSRAHSLRHLPNADRRPFVPEVAASLNPRHDANLHLSNGIPVGAAPSTLQSYNNDNDENNKRRAFSPLTSLSHPAPNSLSARSLVGNVEGIFRILDLGLIKLPSQVVTFYYRGLLQIFRKVQLFWEGLANLYKPSKYIHFKVGQWHLAIESPVPLAWATVKALMVLLFGVRSVALLFFGRFWLLLEGVFMMEMAIYWVRELGGV